MIQEAMRRRPAFDAEESAWIQLADGQQWAFPLPWLEQRARFKGGKAVGTYLTLGYGHAADDLVVAIAECETDEARIAGVASLAAMLLLQNYDLADFELDTLLAFRPSDPTSMEWPGAVMEAAIGKRGRRTRPGGGGAA